MATQISRKQTVTPRAHTAREVVSFNPATGEELGRVPLRSAEEVAGAVERARVAQESWRARSYRERADFVMRARAIVLEELDEIAALISQESGKPAAESISMELVPTLDLMRFFARKTAKLLRPEKISIGLYGLLGRSSTIEYRPLGVVGIISPWNFPWAIPLGEVVMALMAGNTVVLKPSELTPFVALKIGDVFARAGLPEGALEVVTGDGSTGAALSKRTWTRSCSRAASRRARRVAESAARKLIPVVLELGGKDPMIVLRGCRHRSRFERGGLGRVRQLWSSVRVGRALLRA